MTERLYYTDSYLGAFEAAVVDLAEDGRRVYLDRTAFYPTSGGQPFDTGSLGDARVVDVVDEDDRIAHLVDRPLPPGTVRGMLDWARRFDHMQQHTGQHLLSAVLADLFGHATTSVHFGTEGSTLELDAASLSPEQVLRAEERANALVTENRPVEVSFEDVAAGPALRKPSERTGTLRVVTIRDLDRSACGGTHVRATGEIGAVLLRKVERVRRSVRVEFLCGGRAVRRARADFDLLARLALPYSAPPEDLPALLEGQRAELKQSAAGRRELERDLDTRRARELYDATPPGSQGLRHIQVLDDPDLPMERLRTLAQAVTALPRALFTGTTSAPPAIVFATSMDSQVDAARSLRAAMESSGGRGGGNPRLAQGTAPAEKLSEVVRTLSSSAGN